MAGLKSWLWLTTRQGIGNQARLALLQAMGSPENIYYADEAEYLQVPGITRAMLAGLTDKSLHRADNRPSISVFLQLPRLLFVGLHFC